MKSRELPWALISITLTALIPPLLEWNMLFNQSYHDTQRLLQLITLTGLSTITLYQITIGKTSLPALKNPAIQYITLIGIFGFASSIKSEFSRVAFFELGIFFFIFFSSWIISKEVSELFSKKIIFIIKLIIIGCLIYNLKFFLIYATALTTGHQPTLLELITGFDNYRFFNHTQTVTLPLIALFITLNRESISSFSYRWHYASWIALIVWWTLLFASSGRGTLVSTIAATLIISLCKKSALARDWVQVMTLSACAGIASYGILFIGIPLLFNLEPFGFLGQIVQRTIENPTSGRGALWSCATEMILRNPLLGAGPLHYANFCSPLGIAAHPHNWIIQIASEWGLIGLGLFFILLLHLARTLYTKSRAIEHNDSKNQLFFISLTSTGIAILLDGLVSGLIVMPTSQLWLSIYFGIFWGWKKSIESSKEKEIISRQTKTIGVTITATFIVIISFGTYSTYKNIPKKEKESIVKNQKILQPRVWQDGNF